MRFDLHCHTTCSDGTDSPLDLLKKAKDVGLSGLSITDHDTIGAYTPELFSLAEQLDLRLLTGIELSSEWKDNSVHVLGYHIDVHAEELIAFLAELIIRRNIRNEKIIDKLKKKGFSIEPNELDAFKDRTVGRPHIAHLLMQKGYVSSIQEAFQRYLGDNGSCFVMGIKYTPAEAIEQIHKAGGRAVIAHPHFIKKGKVLSHLLELPFDGIECYYGTFQEHQERPWVALSKKKGWIATGGSDYHGLIKPNIPLGCSWVREETFNFLSSKLGSELSPDLPTGEI